MTIVSITGGNFRLIDRLTAQIQRVQTANHLLGLTPEIIETVRQALSSAIKYCENQAIHRCDSHADF